MIRHLTFICFFALLTFSLFATSPGPMSDEEVVRQFVSGTGVDRIIELINGSDVAFDLSDEMLDELRAAGLPPGLIEAMIARQAELNEANAPVVVEEPSAGSSLRIRINPDGDDEQSAPLRVIDLIDEATYEQLRLRTADPTFTDMALFVACRTQDHVADQWRGQTPLGRDFISSKRHRMLHFHPGAEVVDLGGWKKLLKLYRRPDGSAPKVLELALPPEIEIELEPGVAHDLTLGIALRAEERYYLIASDDLDGLVLQEEERVLDAVVRGSRELMHSSLKVKFAQ
jgi:hypothetical protein